MAKYRFFTVTQGPLHSSDTGFGIYMYFYIYESLKNKNLGPFFLGMKIWIWSIAFPKKMTYWRFLKDVVLLHWKIGSRVNRTRGIEWAWSECSKLNLWYRNPELKPFLSIIDQLSLRYGDFKQWYGEIRTLRSILTRTVTFVKAQLCMPGHFFSGIR